MFKRCTATALSLLLLFAATVSLTGEMTPGELFAGVNPERMELSIGGNDDPQRPDYLDAISNRLLRKRVSSRALFVERLAAVISFSSFATLVQASTYHRISPQALYQHQTSLRI